ncbi:hypothetical protein Lgra_0916 [Legionella gratiana]|uniref:VirK protein n=1 Tax=Legionella gratiana TaxID=45066 RepID=A0A378JGV1_9GAMM|nr:hypothetical protein [Legionella gratiana]KTD13624.1 hypothetical protein Lgra_0916 [Legionella gratiana]STX46221.1 Uncharacterised protein [Legionella gratiana]
MYHSANKLLVLILTLISTSLFSATLAPIELTLDPNKPIILTNANIRTTMLCEIHAASNAKNSIRIHIISGKGVFNGTTFKKGDYMVWTVYNMQQIPFTADPGTKAEVTNLGSYMLKAICI